MKWFLFFLAVFNLLVGAFSGDSTDFIIGCVAFWGLVIMSGLIELSDKIDKLQQQKP